jgi:hypothetical protein
MTTTRRISTSIALGLALATSAGPALARPSDLNANGSYITSGRPSMHSQPNRPTAALSTPPATVHAITHDGGFDWGDAGIGAVAAVAMSMLGFGAALSLSHRHAGRTTA